MTVLADQSASVFGSGNVVTITSLSSNFMSYIFQGCYKSGSAKITMGTGSFLDVVTTQPHASLNGLIPLVAWRIRDETCYLAEGSVHDTGVVMEWARSVQLFDDIQQTSDIAANMVSNGGVYFVPGFHGLQAPVQDPTATAGFIGTDCDLFFQIKLSILHENSKFSQNVFPSHNLRHAGLTLASTKKEMLRALLESIAFSQKQLVEAFLSETDYKFEKLVVDGGVARNDFIVQMIANLTGMKCQTFVSNLNLVLKV